MTYFENRLKDEGYLLDSNPDVKGLKVKDMLISMKMDSGHIHTVLPSNEKVKEELIEDLLSDVTSIQQERTKEPPSEVIFRNRQAIGDIFTMTCAIRDFKKAFPKTRVGVITTAMHIWDNNPYIDHQLTEGNIVDIGPGFLTNKSNTWNLHMCNAYRLSIEQKLSLSIPQGEIKPDIWITEEEINKPPIIEGPYWLFVPGGAPGWPAKQYHRWQEVVDGLKDDITIVQLGIKGQYPVFHGVMDFTGKTQDRNTGIRDLLNLFYHCEGSLGLVSMHMHVSGGYGNPCVVVAGAREPFWFTNYFNHQYLGTNGCLPCATKACWACKLEGCRNLINEKTPKCVDIIHPNEVITAVRKYYDGGLLRYGHKSERRPFANIVKEKKVFIVPTTDDVDEQLLKQYDMNWGGGSITDKDWIFIKQLIEKENIKKVLEFGTGLSTLLFQTKVDKIDSFETNLGWIRKISQFIDEGKVKHHSWNGKVVDIPKEQYDLVFVDGPAGGENREFSTKYAEETNAKWILVHDAGREPERRWQEKYLTSDYDLYKKGGHRCHLWKRKEIVQIDNLKPTFRLVTTCRGYGGSERSTLFLLDAMLKEGYNVELFPTGDICGPYLNDIPDGCIIRHDWVNMKEPCDIFMLYSSDMIWGFKDTKFNVMYDLQAKQKIMCLNFKLGGAGQVEWTKNWDKYLFLNSTHESELLKRMPDVKTKVLAPPVDLTNFFAQNINYDGKIRIIRHSSQRDAKWPDYTNELIDKINRMERDIEFYFMPARSDCFQYENVYKFKVNEIPVQEFLLKGNLFWYHLPQGYTEGGPRVIMESMACGIPCIVDNHSGMKDRVTDDTGWLCDDEYQMLNIIKTVTVDDLRVKGIAARERAMVEFNPNNWVKEIINGK